MLRRVCTPILRVAGLIYASLHNLDSVTVVCRSTVHPLCHTSTDSPTLPPTPSNTLISPPPFQSRPLIAHSPVLIISLISCIRAALYLILLGNLLLNHHRKSMCCMRLYSLYVVLSHVPLLKVTNLVAVYRSEKATGNITLYCSFLLSTEYYNHSTFLSHHFINHHTPSGLNLAGLTSSRSEYKCA